MAAYGMDYDHRRVHYGGWRFFGEMLGTKARYSGWAVRHFCRHRGTYVLRRFGAGAGRLVRVASPLR